jgi:hypothetical protein
MIAKRKALQSEVLAALATPDGRQRFFVVGTLFGTAFFLVIVGATTLTVAALTVAHGVDRTIADLALTTPHGTLLQLWHLLSDNMPVAAMFSVVAGFSTGLRAAGRRRSTQANHDGGGRGVQ